MVYIVTEPVAMLGHKTRRCLYLRLSIICLAGQDAEVS